jgi:polygalacturonase
VADAQTFGLRPDTPDVQTQALQQAIDAVSSSGDLDTLHIGPGLYRIGDLHLRSNCRIHLASGCVLKASDHAADIGDASLSGWDRGRACLVNADDCENIAIVGHGHIDGNRAVLDNERYFKGLLLMTNCRGVRLEGPVFSDACGWNTTPRACEDVIARHLKLLSNRPRINCINTDGLNPDGSSNVAIEHCLIHSGDDAVAIKSSRHGEVEPRDVRNVRVRDMLAINNSATCKVGTETCAAEMSGIRFERVDAVKTVRLCAIDAFDEAHIHDVHFENCFAQRLDDPVGQGMLIQLRAPAEAWRQMAGNSRVSDVTLRHISGPAGAPVVLTARSQACGVRDIKMQDVRVDGRPLQAEDIEADENVVNWRIG